jgi:V/A-type H+-transporting ATPase subunit I
MIINVKKVLIYGLKDQIDLFFKQAQEKGFIEFISKIKKPKILTENIKDYISAIKILKKETVLEQIENNISSKDIVKKVLEVENSIEKLNEEKRLVNQEIYRIIPFGNFSKQDLLEIQKSANRIFQFLCIKKSKIEKLKLDNELIFINSYYHLDYFVAINRTRKNYPKMIEITIDQSLDSLRDKILVINERLEKLNIELKDLAKYLNLLKKDFLHELNFYHLDINKEKSEFKIDDKIFTITAWVPKNKLKEFEFFTKEMMVDFAIIEIDKKDKVPTYLENKGFTKVGEDLVNIYDTPASSDKDPSTFVLIAFIIFFAMIVSDAGYGLIYFLIFLFLKFKFKNPKPLLKRFKKLIFLLSTACMAYGVLTGSFFGMDFSYKTNISKKVFLNYLASKKASYHLEKKDDVYQSYLKKYPSIQDSKDGKDFLSKAKKIYEGQEKFEALDTFKDNILMELSILAGVIHLTISLLRYFFRNFSNIGWVFFLIGGYLYFPKILDATSLIHFLNIIPKNLSFFIGEYLTYFGIISAIIIAIIHKRISGIVEVVNLIQVFSDTMSYLRIYALGLAGMIMANTFNFLGVSVGLKFGFMIIIFGHMINVLLAIMGGVIHGLRLNFIEWYHYSFYGDGKLFNPLKLLK